VIGKLPKPNFQKAYISDKYICDPNYDWIKIEMSKLTDHFYDTGVYKVEWENAKYFKTKHPYMGKMSFPENPDRTSRTIVATRFPSARESILYKSEYGRV
jgi:DNA (cytosine-5)-methyltransferase 1